MLEVIILSVGGRPRFIVDADATAPLIRQLVARQFGWASIGVPHSWAAVFV